MRWNKTETDGLAWTSQGDTCHFFGACEQILIEPFSLFSLCWVFVAAHRLSLVVTVGGHSRVAERASLCGGLLLQSSGPGYAGSRAQAQQLWCTSLAAPQHADSSRTRDRTCVPCIGRWILYHWTTKEVLDISKFSEICTFFSVMVSE